LKRELTIIALSALAAGCTADQWERFPSPDDAVAAVPWFSTMYRGPAVQVYKWNPPRPPVEGTVPVSGNEPRMDVLPQNLPVINALRNPVQRTATSIERGAERYEIYCTPCHGSLGDGQGPVPVGTNLAYVPSLLTPQARAYTDGYLYAITRHGRGLMPAYGDRILGADRWHVVNYVRVLQGASP
jgi:mono/diheme cytochrome c family protein